VIRSNLKALLQSRNKSLYRLEKETGIAHTTLTRIRDSKTKGIDYRVLEAICRALECEVGELLEVSDEKPTAAKSAKRRR